MNEKEFMNQKVGEMTIDELAEAIKIKNRKTLPSTKDFMELLFEQHKTIKEEMESKFVSIMNEKGMVWCNSFVCSFINVVNDRENIDKTMMVVMRKVWNNLCSKYEEFELKPINIPRAAMEMQSKIHTILLNSHHIDNPFFDDFHKGVSGWGLFKKK